MEVNILDVLNTAPVDREIPMNTAKVITGEIAAGLKAVKGELRSSHIHKRAYLSLRSRPGPF
jgi:hypothetical protein